MRFISQLFYQSHTIVVLIDDTFLLFKRHDIVRAIADRIIWLNISKKRSLDTIVIHYNVIMYLNKKPITEDSSNKRFVFTINTYNKHNSHKLKISVL